MPPPPRPTLAALRAFAARRADVARLLDDAASRKIQRAGTTHALELARAAYERASEAPPLRPWAPLAAYRLAHLLLRGPRTPEALLSADELFVEAAREPLLAPYPRLYRLAVLARLGVPRDRVERAFDEAVRDYDTLARTRRQAAVHAPDADDEPADPDAVRAPLHTDLFGMLELAGYFLDLDRTRLEGRGALPELLRDDHWRVVGPEPHLADVALSEAAADVEVDALAETYGPALVFRLPAARGAATIRFVPGGEAEPRPPAELPHRAALLLACLLRQDARDVRSLVERVTDGDGASHRTTFRQVKHRLGERLVALGVPAPAELVVEAPGERPRLAPELVVFGAVNEAGYRDRE